MDLVGKKVVHTRFGRGLVIEHARNSIKVSFKLGGIKEKVEEFPFPKSFDGFLTIEDDELSEQIKQLLIVNKDIANKKKKANDEKKDRELPKPPPNIRTNSISYVDDKEYRLFKRQLNSMGAFFDAYNNALLSEIEEVKLHGGKKIHIPYGTFQFRTIDGKFRYDLEMDEEQVIPDDAIINVWIANSKIPAKAVYCDGLVLSIESAINFGDVLEDIYITYEAWMLLELLRSRFIDIELESSNITKSLIIEDAVEGNNYNIYKGQNTAVNMSLKQPIVMLWGPPGTGKTQTLAKIALKHIEVGHRVLMVSHSNVSVDEATIRVFGMSDNNTPGKIVRYGYPRRKDVSEHEYLSSFNLVLYQNPVIKTKRDFLLKRMEKTDNKESLEYKEVIDELKEIRKDIRNKEKEFVNNSPFIATTITKAIASEEMLFNKFDVVIFDEASMAYVPQVVVASNMAKKHFICMGDFCQLPPIVQSSNDSILNKDIFYYCGISYAVEKKYSHRWLCMLDVQYRMHHTIADFISKGMYKSLLKTYDSLDFSSVLGDETLGPESMELIDLSKAMSVCFKLSDKSRVNIMSAYMSVHKALSIPRNVTVGIITPYNAQARLIRALLRDIKHNNIFCATVHQFQGSEKEVIIYDAVDCYRIPYPGMLLSSAKNNYADRLFNVALSRTKGKFILLANADYIEKGLSNKRLFKQSISQIKKGLGYYTVDHLKYIKSTNEDFMIYKENNVVKDYINDIKNAKVEILLDIPYPVKSDQESRAFIREIARILEQKDQEGVNINIRIENFDSLPHYILENAEIDDYRAINPLTVIDKQITWFGVPFSEATFHSQGVKLPITYRPVMRVNGKNTARVIKGLLK